MTFEGDLRFGQRYERKARGFFKHERGVDKRYIPKGKHKEFDFEIKRVGEIKKTMVEVKTDKMAARTGNFAIEFECNGVDSGINYTTADIWIHFIVDKKKEDVYIFPIADLRKLVKNCRTVRGGDGGRVQMYLLPVSNCRDYRREVLQGSL